MKLNIDETKNILASMNQTCKQIISACNKLESNADALGENLSDNVSELSRRIVSQIKASAIKETKMITETNCQLEKILETMKEKEKNFSKGLEMNHE